MLVLPTKVDPQSKRFVERAAEMRELVAEYHERLDNARRRRSEGALAHLSRLGKMTARQRIEKLLDPGTRFLELSPLAATDMYDGAAPQAGVITGVGTVAGRRVAVSANDPSVKAGTLYPMGVKKSLRLQEIILENRLPAVALVDSGGAFLPLQSEIFADKDMGGRVFYNQCRMAREGIPQLSVVLGHCTAGGAYMPALTDHVIMVRGTGAIFLGGPPLVKAATGQDVGVEELGGADLHTSVSGVADHLAETEDEALDLARRVVATWPPPRPAWEVDRVQPQPPKYDPEELYGIVPVDLRRRYDVKEVIARIVDGSRFHEWKPRYGTTLVTGWARIWGYKVGILANHGVLLSESALKGTQFIQLCDSREVPLLFLHNISGFMVGPEVERGGITKDGAKMVNAVANARVPKFTVITGGSFGAGNYAMCGRAYGPRFLFSWPHSRISVMGGESAAAVLTQVFEEKAKRMGQTMDDRAKEAVREQILDTYDRESSAMFSTARVWDDGIIDPVDTRDALGVAIEVSTTAPLAPQGYGWMRM
jgi:3-methylcrotonyl-CoA carboxylase beta subunit/propionyl-CoA carboxylase